MVELLEEDNKELGAQLVDPLAAAEEPCCGNSVVVGGDSKELVGGTIGDPLAVEHAPVEVDI